MNNVADGVLDRLLDEPGEHGAVHLVVEHRCKPLPRLCSGHMGWLLSLLVSRWLIGGVGCPSSAIQDVRQELILKPAELQGGGWTCRFPLLWLLLLWRSLRGARSGSCTMQVCRALGCMLLLRNRAEALNHCGLTHRVVVVIHLEVASRCGQNRRGQGRARQHRLILRIALAQCFLPLLVAIFHALIAAEWIRIAPWDALGPLLFVFTARSLSAR